MTAVTAIISWMKLRYMYWIIFTFLFFRSHQRTTNETTSTKFSNEDCSMSAFPRLTPFQIKLFYAVTLWISHGLNSQYHFILLGVVNQICACLSFQLCPLPMTGHKTKESFPSILQYIYAVWANK